MIIKGANIEEVPVEYKKLSDYNWTNDKEKKEIIKYLEDLYIGIKCHANDYEINPMRIDEDGNVILDETSINHRCTNSIENLEMIAKYGILASEWFGQLESEREGCFCVFVSRMKSKEYPYVGDLAEDNRSRLNMGPNVLLFYDNNNPLLKYLMHLDYFEFEHQKKINTDYKSLYTKDELELLESLIEPISPSGQNMRSDYESKTNYWSAIPGGIPSEFINGICIKRNKYTNEELDEINSLFPNAIIFDSSTKVIRNSENNNQLKTDQPSHKR